MINSKDFTRLIYRKPKLKYQDTRIKNVLGLDSEAYSTGRPFMICVSDGTIMEPRSAIGILTTKYLSHNILVYNMRYDAGALLYSLPRCVMRMLWETGEVEYRKILIKYIPHKYLEFALKTDAGPRKVRVWDVAQFYKGMSLDGAAKKYLGDSKIDIGTKTFSRAYVKKNYARIAQYCIHDAELCRRLGEHLFSRLDKFGLVPSRIYSPASISFQYYTKKSRYVTAWRMYTRYEDALKYACDSYRGGKFEISARGAFKGHEYDITSAYPYFVSNLIDISRASVRYSKKYEKDATYGFLRVGFKSDGSPYPCGIPYHKSLTMVYPSGVVYTTITKVEYEWMVAHGFDITVYDGWYLYCPSKRYPYRDVTQYLFSIKDQYKKSDPCMYAVIKVVLNGIYGKKAQCIEQHDGTVLAGAGWNPVYASYITAQTRIMVTDVQYNLGRDCIAVHTDSVMTTRRHDTLIREGLGGYSYVTGGDGVLIASGMYQIANECRFKGFKPARLADGSKDTWFNILRSMGQKSVHEYRYRKVESWYEAMAKNHTKNRINLFYDDVKRIDLNCDVKRAWYRKATAHSLLSGLEYAPPVHVVQKKPADFV